MNVFVLKIRFFHVRKGPNIGSEPNFHSPMTSNVKDYQIYDVSQNVKSLGLLEIIPDNRICGSIVNTELYGSPPSK